MVQPPDDGADPRADRPEDDGRDDPAGGDIDERWAAIVAELGEPAGADWPDDTAPGSQGAAGSDRPDDARDAAGDDAAARRGGHVVRGSDERVLSGRDWDATAQYDAAEEAVDEQEHFVPPDPGPVLTSDPLRLLTWAVAIGVPVLYVVLLVAWHHPPGWLAPVAGVLLVAAIAVLVWRMPHRRDTDGDDSGAVV